MNRAMALAVGLSLCAIVAFVGHAQNYTILHNFGDPAAAPDGANPRDNLVLDGGMLYGMTPGGGANGGGTVFSMNTDGSDYTKLHEFPDPAAAPDGAAPLGGLSSDGGVLYGMTIAGGANGGGTVFSMNTDGSGYKKLHEFPDPAAAPDGTTLFGNVTPDGGALYGMTQLGGANGGGIVFSMNTDGSGYTKLHEFPDPAAAPDGTSPFGSVTLDGGALYGMTINGGANGVGIIFSMNTDGSGYTKLHEFPDPAAAPDGAAPMGSLISDGSALYGMTVGGGAGWGGGYNNGTIFSINTDGTGYKILHDFSTGPYDGSGPQGSLISDNSTLYGMSYNGGAYGPAPGYGAVFSINTDGSNFSILHSFAGRPGDGQLPMGTLVSDGSALYGMTYYGGAHGAAPGDGVAFSYALPTATPSPTPLIDLNVNKTTFSTTDHITITANAQPTSTSFFPYIRVIFPDNTILYLVRGSGFTPVQTPYLAGGPFYLLNPINNYLVLDANFSIVQTGAFTLEGYANDVLGNVVGTVDRNELQVQ